MSSAVVYCESCGSTVKGAHQATCKAIREENEKAREQKKLAEHSRKLQRNQTALKLEFDDLDPEIETMQAIARVMDYQIKRCSLTQRQIDRIGNWLIDKYMSEIQWP